MVMSVFIHFKHDCLKDQFIILHICVTIKVTETGFTLDSHSTNICRKILRYVFVSLPDRLKPLDLLQRVWGLVV